jgi:hypothetical protein
LLLLSDCSNNYTSIPVSVPHIQSAESFIEPIYDSDMGLDSQVGQSVVSFGRRRLKVPNLEPSPDWRLGYWLGCPHAALVSLL